MKSLLLVLFGVNFLSYFANPSINTYHDHVIKWKIFPPYWPFVRGIHRSPVNSPHKGQWHGALVFSLTCVWINGWVNNRETSYFRRFRAHYDVTVIWAHKRFPTSTHMLVSIYQQIWTIRLQFFSIWVCFLQKDTPYIFDNMILVQLSQWNMMSSWLYGTMIVQY